MSLIHSTKHTTLVIILTIIICGSLLSIRTAHAETRGDLEKQIESLHNLVGKLTNELSSIRARRTPVSDRVRLKDTVRDKLASDNNVRCLTLPDRPLYRGRTDASTDGQVTALQRFLAKDKSLYPEGLVTGYYGPATERAIQRFQAREKIVQSGSPESTGYGMVGRLTRARFSKICDRAPDTVTTDPVDEAGINDNTDEDIEMDDGAGDDAEVDDDIDSDTETNESTGDDTETDTSGVTIQLSPVSSATSYNENDPSTTNDDEGTYTIVFDVTASDGDAFIPSIATRGQYSEDDIFGDAGASYLVKNAAGQVVTDGNAVASLTSTADREGAPYKVPEGETEQFTLTVEFNPTQGDFFVVQLHSANFTDTPGGLLEQYLASPSQDYRTDTIAIAQGTSGNNNLASVLSAMEDVLENIRALVGN